MVATTLRARTVPCGVSTRNPPSPSASIDATGVPVSTGSAWRAPKPSIIATKASRVRNPSGAPPPYRSSGITVWTFGVFIRNEAQRCVRQVSQMRLRSKTRWSSPAAFNAWLTPSPANPPPTTTASRS